MKKNVLKILLALVMVAMVFALVACGGGDEKKSTTPSSSNTTDEPAVDKVAELSSAINEVVGGVSPYLTSFQAIKKNSKVGLNIGVGGYYDNVGEEPSAGNFKLSLQGTAQATDPELKVAFSLGEDKDGEENKDYVAIGYQDGHLYLCEPLSLINAPKNAKPRAIDMDASYLSDGVDNVAGFGMEKLEGVVGKLGGIDLGKFVSDFLDKNKAVVKGVAKFIDSDKTSNNKEIALVIESNKVGQLIDAVSSFVNGWKDITKTIDNALTTAYDSFGLYVNGNTVGIDKEKATATGSHALDFDTIKKDFMPGIKIIGGFDKENTAADKSLNAVKVELDMTKTMKLSVGLNIDLKKLAIGSSSSPNFSGYTAQNLTSSINVGLGKKDRFAVLTATANTATAFKDLTTNVATASLKIGDKTNPAAGIATATYDGQSFFLDLTGLNTIKPNDMNTVFAEYGYTFEYGGDNAADFEKNKGDAFNVKYALAYILNNIGKEDADETSAATTTEEKELPEVADTDKLKTEGIWTTVYNILIDFQAGCFGAYDYKGADGYLYKGNTATGTYDKVKDEEGVAYQPHYKTSAKQEDVTEKLAEFDWITKYVNVELTKDGKGQTFEAIGDSLKKKFDDVKKIFTGDDAAAEAKDYKARVALFGNDGKDLVHVVTMFVNVPTLDATDETKFAKDDDGKFIVAKDLDITPALAKKYIQAIFALDDADAVAHQEGEGEAAEQVAGSYDSWPQEVKDIFAIGNTGFSTAIIDIVLGIDLDTLCGDGIYLYAKTTKDAGLVGAVGIENADEESYFEIGGSIGFISELPEGAAAMTADQITASNIVVEKVAAQNAPDETDGEGDETDDVGKEYEMNGDIWDAIIATLKYVFPAQQAQGE